MDYDNVCEIMVAACVHKLADDLHAPEQRVTSLDIILHNGQLPFAPSGWLQSMNDRYEVMKELWAAKLKP